MRVFTSLPQPLTVRMDPRVTGTPAAWAQQFSLSQQIYEELVATAPAAAQLEHVVTLLKGLEERAGQTSAAQPVAAAQARATALLGQSEGRPNPLVAVPDSFSMVRGRLKTLLTAMQAADVAPTPQQAEAVADRCKAAAELMRQWEQFKTTDVPSLNQHLRQAHLPEIDVAVPSGVGPTGDDEE